MAMKTLTHWMDIPRMLHRMDDILKDKAMVHHRLLGSPLNPYRLPENDRKGRWLVHCSDGTAFLHSRTLGVQLRGHFSCRWGRVHPLPLRPVCGVGRAQQPCHWRSRSINNSQINFYVSTTFKLMFHYLHTQLVHEFVWKCPFDTSSSKHFVISFEWN